MRAFCLRSPRRPRLQRLTQCFIARTEHTSSTPKPVIVKQLGAVRTITYGSVEPRIDAHMPFARHQESRRPRLDWRNISTPTSCQRGQIWKPKQSHAASSPRLHALRPCPKTSHDLPAASTDQQRGAGGSNGLGGLTKGGAAGSPTVARKAHGGCCVLANVVALLTPLTGPGNSSSAVSCRFGGGIGGGFGLRCGQTACQLAFAALARPSLRFGIPGLSESCNGGEMMI